MTSSALVPFQVTKDNVLCNKSTEYLVLEFIGEGCFGKVAKCINLKTSETTAIKIHNGLAEHYEEVNMLQKLRSLDPVKNNLLEYKDSFITQDMPCVAFEMLDRSLWDFVMQRRAPLSLNEIRPIARQLLVAFEALKGVGIIHTDLKPDNVMLVNQEDEPFRVKLIDFGLARPASEVKQGMVMQPLGYRAPEVDLGLPICEAIDMWGLGCILAFLFFGRDIFCGQSTYDTMRTVCSLLGQPEDHVLDAGSNTWEFFQKEQPSPYYHTWRLKTPTEHRDATGVWPQTSEWCFDTVGGLEEAIKSQSNPTDFIEREDTMAFSHLLEWLLSPDGEMRYTPAQALRHDYITMCHLTEHMESSSYVQEAYELMVVSPTYDSYEDDDALKDLLSDMEASIVEEKFSNIHAIIHEDTVPRGYCDPPTCIKPFRAQKKGFDAERLTPGRAPRQNCVTRYPIDHMDFSSHVHHELKAVSPPEDLGDPFSLGGPGYK